jgi:16S rRNA (cytosine967-C5)-methyltransferase
MAAARGASRAIDRGGPQRGDRPRYRRDPARRAAYDVLEAVADRDAYANLLLPRLLTDRRITGRDAALATELTYGTLRGQGTYDEVLAACSDRPLDRLDPPVLHVLRLGAHQLLATRVGSHAAVATSVDLAKDVVGPRASGYVNAVLRRVATRDLEQWMAIAAPSRADDPDGYLAVRYSYPPWIVAAYRDALGGASASIAGASGASVAGASVAGASAADAPVAGASAANAPVAGASGASVAGASVAGASVADAPVAGASVAEVEAEVEAALAAGNERPRVTLAIRPGAGRRDELLPEGAEPAAWSPYGFVLAGGDPAALIADGVAAVQDEASQLAAVMLARTPVLPAPGSAPSLQSHPSPAWLDMCAGPGGKARMLAGLAALDGARLLAAEVHPHRARLVASAVDEATAVIVADGREPAWRDVGFERVLVDVPCTGLGALRRRPEARWRKSPDDLVGLGQLQRELLWSALDAVRPGGVVAYVTCSPVPAETSEVVLDVAGPAAAGVEILDAPALLPDVPGLRATADPRFAQFWPHRHGTDAIFVALLRRTR